MSNPFDKYGIDRVAEAKGAVVQIDDMQFFLRSATAANRGWRYALALAARRHREELDRLKPDPADDEAEQQRKLFALFDVNETLQIEAFADCVILGWAGLTNGDGHALEYSRDACVRVLEACPQLWDELKEKGLDVKRFPIAHAAAQGDGEQLGKS